MIGIVDYGMGNLRSVQKAIEFLGGSAVITGDKETLSCCERIILPGVGSFAAGMENLCLAGLDGFLKTWERPLLGICLGMQFLLEGSEEEGYHGGLGLIGGRAVRFLEGKVPHIGWNSVTETGSLLFAGIPDGTQFYFVHSYYATTQGEEMIGKTEYGVQYASAVGRGLLFGVQFHPEKSGDAGLQLLRNFMRL